MSRKKQTIQSLLFEQQMLGILVFTVLVLFVWIAGSIYFTYNKSTISQDEALVVTPLDPKIDTVPLEDISMRKWWKGEELQNFQLSIALDEEKNGGIRTTLILQSSSASATIRPTPIVSPTATTSALPTQ